MRYAFHIRLLSLHCANIITFWHWKHLPLHQSHQISSHSASYHIQDRKSLYFLQLFILLFYHLDLLTELSMLLESL
jgi:hypothetical protein